MDAERRRRMCTGKKRFKDEAAATFALHNLMHVDEDGRGGPVRVYRCEYCERWHLTSQQAR